MAENYWRPSITLRLVLIWLTILFITGWLPLIRGAFDGPTYEWGSAYFSKQFSGKGTGGDYWFLIAKTALGIVSLFLGWRGARPVFLALSITYQIIGLADAILSSIANPEQYRFQGDTLGIDVNLTWIAPALYTFFLFLTILWAVRDAMKDWQRPVLPWSRKNTRWLIGLLALLPIQCYLLHYGSPESTEDKIGVLITIFQWLFIGIAFSAKTKTQAQPPRRNDAMLRCFVLLLFVAQAFASEEKKPFNRAVLDDIELEYEIRGTGEPVILVHAGLLYDWFKPLVDDPILTNRYRLVKYHRVGYGNSTHLKGPVSISDHARHLRLLMEHLKIERAHIVGHSSGGMVALQFALESPDFVQSIALLESARPSPMTEIQKSFSAKVGQVARQAYKSGDKTLAVDIWMRGVCAPDYRTVLDKALPGAFDQAVGHADTFFGQELPAVMEWTFTQEDASRIKNPVLAVVGENSIPTFRERREVMLKWFTNIESFDLPNANHLLHVQNPREMATALNSFFGKHPIRKK